MTHWICHKICGYIDRFVFASGLTFFLSGGKQSKVCLGIDESQQVVVWIEFEAISLNGKKRNCKKSFILTLNTSIINTYVAGW